MIDRPTPETDAEIDAEMLCACYPNEYVDAEFARKLERERDEAREAAAKWESSSDKLADTLRTDAYQYADYILNHYDRNSHMDKLCLTKSLVENGYGSKAAEIEAL